LTERLLSIRFRSVQLLSFCKRLPEPRVAGNFRPARREAQFPGSSKWLSLFCCCGSSASLASKQAEAAVHSLAIRSGLASTEIWFERVFAPKLTQFPGSVDGVLSQQEAERRLDIVGCFCSRTTGCLAGWEWRVNFTPIPAFSAFRDLSKSRSD
jgi:hypothetical protein